MLKLALLFAGVVAAQTAVDYDEAFTIFIDLDDFHVTQVDNHEFLSHSEIGEHDNVVLHLSESEVRHHQRLHDTHSCEHPAEVHEVVSFIQEKMYEQPAAPNFIDDTISSNYAQGEAWESIKKAMSTLPQQQPMWNMGMPSFPSQLPVPAAPSLPSQQAAPVVAATVAAPKLTQSTTASVTAPVADEAKEEEEAVRRFKDAYRAYKYLNRAVGGLDFLANQAASSASPSTAAEVDDHKPTWFDSLLDDDDRRIMNLFSTKKPAPVETPVSDVFDYFSNGKNSAFAGAMENPFSAVAEQALQKAVGAGVIPPPSPEFTQMMEEHKHHHHHHHDNQNLVAPQPVPQATSVGLTDQEKLTLESLITKLAGAGKATQVASALQSVLADKPSAPVSAPVAVSPAASVPQQGASRPSAPLATSHIEKAPGPADFIPESVYQQQSVPFSESIQQAVKHVPKRILIPRMEEPGPVIGGGSRPSHISIPFDDIKASGNTRPAPPSQTSISSAIETTTKGDVSIKASAVAAANDDALTQPEVVIFQME